jgi:hypothetical protein
MMDVYALRDAQDRDIAAIRTAYAVLADDAAEMLRGGRGHEAGYIFKALGKLQKAEAALVYARHANFNQTAPVGAINRRA